MKNILLIVRSIYFYLLLSKDILCQPPFEKNGTGCYMPIDTKRSWYNAELDCNSYGGNVHLVTTDTPQVRISTQHVAILHHALSVNCVIGCPKS